MWFKVRDEVGDGAFRRLAQKVDLELLARLAKSDCLGREPGVFNCEAMDWFLERARALGVEHRPPAPILLGRHLLELGLKPGPAGGRDPEGGLRTAARWNGDDLDQAIAAASELLGEQRQARRHTDRTRRRRRCDHRRTRATSCRASCRIACAVLALGAAAAAGLPASPSAFRDLDGAEIQLLQLGADLRAIADRDHDQLLRHDVLLGRGLDLRRRSPPTARAGSLV